MSNYKSYRLNKIKSSISKTEVNLIIMLIYIIILDHNCGRYIIIEKHLKSMKESILL